MFGGSWLAGRVLLYRRRAWGEWEVEQELRPE
jgi:hypothetical protein